MLKIMSASEHNTSFTGNGTSPVYLSVGDFTPFYVAIAISSIILGSIILLNIICCCSRFSDYWLDRHTGNRWIVSIWSETPHKQPPIDLTELNININQVQHIHSFPKEYHDELHNESEFSKSVSKQPLTSSQEYLELHKRESDI